MTAKEILRSIIIDVEAMKCQAPRCFECMSREDQEHWFGPFENVFDGHIQWPNLGILVEEAKRSLDARDANQDELVASLTELHNWMRSHLGASDGVHEMLCRSHHALTAVGKQPA